jgi:hydroxymethylpyrimidine/phosphomethylpyrimidine kinase
VLLEREDDWTIEAMRMALPDLLALGPEWVLLKGGHLQDSGESNDLLHGPGGTVTFAAPRIATRNDHGTGCTLSSAIAALLPSRSVEESVRQAKAFLHAALAASDALDVGHGHGPVHHFHRLWPAAETEG